MTFSPWSAPMEGKSSKRSNEASGRRGLRARILVLAVVALLLVGVALFFVESDASSSGGQPGLITTASATGVPCGDPSLPQAAEQVEQGSAFSSISGGLCYDYLGGNATVLSFAYFNGTLAYPCGTYPLEVPQSVVVYTLAQGQAPGAFRVFNSSAIPAEFYPRGPCPSDTPVRVVSVTDVGSLIPAVPQLNVTVSSGAQVTGLKAILTLNGGVQRIAFGSVTQSKPLGQGAEVSEVVITTGLNFTADQVYPMTLEGNLANGQSFDYTVQVEVADIP